MPKPKPGEAPLDGTSEWHAAEAVRLLAECVGQVPEHAVITAVRASTHATLALLTKEPA